MCACASAGGAGANWSAVQILQRGPRQLHRNKPNHPAKSYGCLVSRGS